MASPKDKNVSFLLTSRKDWEIKCGNGNVGYTGLPAYSDSAGTKVSPVPVPFTVLEPGLSKVYGSSWFPIYILKYQNGICLSSTSQFPFNINIDFNGGNNEQA